MQSLSVMFQRRRVPNVPSQHDSHGGPQEPGEDDLPCLIRCGHCLLLHSQGGKDASPTVVADSP